MQHMTNLEKKLWDFVVKHKLAMLVIISTVFSLVLRFPMRNFISGDMRESLIPWYDSIKGMGGFKALSTQVGDYNIPYQTLIALMTYLPLTHVHAYKLLSTLFDFALGAAVAGCVYEITKNGMKSAFAYIATVNLPIVILDSAIWGQCDSIYTFFLVLTLWLLLRKKATAAFISYGFAFAFKLQAIFFLPFLIFYYVWSRRISLWRFFLIPFPLIALSLGGLLQGRSVTDLYTVYFNQTNEITRLSANYPSFWNMLFQDGVTSHYAEMKPYCILAVVILLACIMVWLVRKQHMDAGTQLLTAALMMYACVLFLPAMHERYDFPVLLFILAACFIFPKVIPTALALLIIDLQTYGYFLFQKEPVRLDVLAIPNLLGFVYLTYITAKQVRASDIENQEKV